MSKEYSDAVAQESSHHHVEYEDGALARLGKKPALKRIFGPTTALGFSCTVLVTWEGAMLMFLVGLQNGGPAGLVYGFIFIWIGTLSVFATLSELVSMAPIASGQYHWVAMLAPASARRALSYITGWLTVCGWQALVASGGFLNATLLQSVALITHPSYLQKWKNWHGTLLYWGVILVSIFFNTVVAKWLPALEGSLLVLHVVGFFAVCIPLLVLSEHNDSAFVFRTFLYEGGWPSGGLAFCIGLLGNAFAFLGADGAMHMAEEIHDAPVVLPRALLGSVMLNGTLGFAMMIVVLFCISDLDLALAESPMYPVMSIFRQGLGSRAGATVLASLIVVLSFSCTIGTMASSSRVFWAFSRDRGLPGWKFLQKVDQRMGIPLNAVVTTSIIACVLSFVNIGNPTAFNGVISLTVAALFGSYLLAAGLLLYRRCKGDIEDVDDSDSEGGIANTMGGRLVWGPWRLSRVFGIINNLFSCIYLIFILFFSFWPSKRPVTPETMNWAVLVTGVVIIFSTGYYFTRGKKTYNGPIVEN